MNQNKKEEVNEDAESLYNEDQESLYNENQTEKCHLEFDEKGYLTCSYNHKAGEDCLMKICHYCNKIKCECYNVKQYNCIMSYTGTAKHLLFLLSQGKKGKLSFL